MIFDVLLAGFTKENATMALDQSALSDLLDALRAGGDMDFMREAMRAQSLESTGSLSRARTPKSHSCTRVAGRRRGAFDRRVPSSRAPALLRWSREGGIHVMSCAEQPEDGQWVNADQNTRSLTRANLRFICQDQVLNGQLYPPGPPWYMHLWGACSPTDCDWGEVGAQAVTVGTRNFVHAVYRQSFATRYVYADMSLFRAGQLWIWMWTDFSDPARPDYESQNWFTRV